MTTTSIQIDPHVRADAAAPTFNIASYLPSIARRAPDRPAVIVQKSRGGRLQYEDPLTFAELEAMSNRYANGLAAIGIGCGLRVLLMVRPGGEFVSLMFALFKVGAVPVLIDPGMGVARMLECIGGVDLHYFIGIPAAHVIRLFRRRAFRTVRQAITVGRRWCWGGRTLSELAAEAPSTFPPVKTRRNEPAAILFTSGSTGPAKGVVYEHGMFDAQIRAIQSAYGIEEGEMDLPGFAPFALFSTAMGMTSVYPAMTQPATVNPATIVDAVGRFQVTNTFGSPAMWNRVSSYCLDRGLKLASLRRVLIAGAPVSWRLMDRVKRILSDGADVHTPYGATEALPVSSISGREALTDCARRTRAGAGTCVGRPMPGIDVRLIRICEAPIVEWSDDLAVPDGQTGEIVVAGPVVTKEYFGPSRANDLAKIRDGDQIRHRMGDVGYRDGRGRLWFCGRKAHRVVTEHGTLFSDPCEAVFNEHPAVAACALVGVGPVGRQSPVIIVEPIPKKFPRGRNVASFQADLIALGHTHELTRSIERVLFHRALPVDVRHNAKIDREALAIWAATRLA